MLPYLPGKTIGEVTRDVIPPFFLPTRRLSFFSTAKHQFAPQGTGADRGGQKEQVGGDEAPVRSGEVVDLHGVESLDEEDDPGEEKDQATADEFRVEEGGSGSIVAVLP